MLETSVRTYSRAVGILLIVSMAGGWFGEMYVPSLMSAGNPAATANQLRLHEDLFRLGFAAYLMEAISDIVLAWLFYLLLRPVHRHLALLSAFFGLVSTSLFAVTKMFYYAAPTFVRPGTDLTAFSPAQLDAFASLFVSLYAGLSGLTMLFYGTAWIIRGYLTVRSGYLPRFLGVIMIAAGAGFAVKTFSQVLAPAYSADALLLPMFLNALFLAIWMLTKGVDKDRWPNDAC